MKFSETLLCVILHILAPKWSYSLNYLKKYKILKFKFKLIFFVVCGFLCCVRRYHLLLPSITLWPPGYSFTIWSELANIKRSFRGGGKIQSEKIVGVCGQKNSCIRSGEARFVTTLSAMMSMAWGFLKWYTVAITPWGLDIDFWLTDAWPAKI